MRLATFVLPLAVVTLPALAALPACASSSPDAPTASPTGARSTPLSASSTTPPALDVLTQGGPFAFALDESDPGRFFHDKCQKESGGDAARESACYAHIHDEAAGEGIRFSFDADRHLVWTSYVHENGQEVVVLEAPLSAAMEGDNVVVGTLAGPARGPQLEGKTFPPGKQLRFEIVDAKTVVMPDPDKGRLVFHHAE